MKERKNDIDRKRSKKENKMKHRLIDRQIERGRKYRLNV